MTFIKGSTLDILIYQKILVLQSLIYNFPLLVKLSTMIMYYYYYYYY